MKTKTYLILTVLFFTTLSCKLFKSETGSMPKNPKTIVITWRKSGGMLPKSESIYISNDSCMYSKYENGNRQELPFTLTNDQLNNLYSVFISNKFNEIETENQQVMDRGGVTIKLLADGQDFKVSNSGGSFIKKEFYTQYENILKAITSTTVNEMVKLKKLVVIKLDKSLSESKYLVIINVNGESFYKEYDDGEYSNQEILLYPTNNHFQVYLMERGSTFNKTIKNISVVLKAIPESKVITLGIKNNNLIAY